MLYDVKHYGEMIGNFPDFQTACRVAQLVAVSERKTLAVVYNRTGQIEAVYPAPTRYEVIRHG